MPGPHGGVRAPAKPARRGPRFVPSRLGPTGRTVSPRPMPRLLALALAASLSACAAPAAPLALDAAHPASPQAAPSPTPDPLADLAPVPQPDLPAVLRPEPASVTDPGQMDHGQTNHGQMPSVTAASRPDAAASNAAPLAAAVGAYLDVQAALASDQTAPDAAARLADALRRSTETAPAGDPHLWHRLSAEVAAARSAADALRRSETVGDARAAFGDLSVPFAALVEAAGAGDGLVRHTCGMTAGAPEGGVWLQRAGPVRNPYFGSRMLLCSRDARPAGAPGDDR